MRQAALVVVVLALVGCGGDPATPEEMLQGSWATDLGNGCTLGATFAGITYEMDTICGLAGGGTGLEAEIGSFTAAGGKLVTTPTKVTCATGAAVTSNYTVGADQLMLVTPAAVLSLRRITPGSSAGGAATFGCFNGGKFTPGPIHGL